MAKRLERKNALKMPIRTSASDTLKETLEAYKVPQKDFAERIGISTTHLSDILSRKRFMTEPIALRIQEVTGISAKFLLRLDFQYKLEQLSEPEGLDDSKAYDWAAMAICH